MSETTNRYEIYEVDHRTYGGELTSFDFYGHHTMCTITRKILKDYAFDKKCMRNTNFKNRKEK